MTDQRNICYCGEYGGGVHTRSARCSGGELRTLEGEPALTQSSGLPGTREPVVTAPQGNAGESPPRLLSSNEITPSPREWLIRKLGYYYRPNRAGYTASVDEAGRYTETEAKTEAAIEPWHMAAVHQSAVEPIHSFKNFHRQLCERFGYAHDEVDWQRDQVSLIEHIAKRLSGDGSQVETSDRLPNLVARLRRINAINDNPARYDSEIDKLTACGMFIAPDEYCELTIGHEGRCGLLPGTPRPSAQETKPESPPCIWRNGCQQKQDCEAAGYCRSEALFPQKAPANLLHADEDVFMTCPGCQLRIDVRRRHICPGPSQNGSTESGK